MIKIEIPYTLPEFRRFCKRLKKDLDGYSIASARELLKSRELSLSNIPQGSDWTFRWEVRMIIHKYISERLKDFRTKI